MKIYLCRHGQTTGDIEDRYGGSYDDHLTDEGKSQGQKLAEQLKGKGIEKIYTSSLSRAVETSEIIKGSVDCDVGVVADLQERNQNGILSGLTRAEAKEKYPELVEEVKDYKNTITGAESYEDFNKRILSAFFTLAKSDHKIIAIVSHGGPIRVILRQVYPNAQFAIEDCAFAELEANGKEIKILNLTGIQIKNS